MYLCRWQIKSPTTNMKTSIRRAPATVDRAMRMSLESGVTVATTVVSLSSSVNSPLVVAGRIVAG